MMDISSKSKEKRGKTEMYAKRAAKRKRSIRRAIVTLSVFVALAFSVWHFILTANIKRYVLQLLEQKINGTVDFDTFHVNIFTGTVRVKNARLILTGESTPFVTVPMVRVDALALRRMDVIVRLENPAVRVERTENGVFNFNGIIKPPKVRKGPSKWDIAIDFDGMTIDYGDSCGIPPKSLANLRGGNNAVAKFEQFCAASGVKPYPAYNPQSFDFTTRFERVTGGFKLTAATQTVNCDLRGIHAGSDFTTKFTYNLDTGDLSAKLNWGEEDYGTFAPFVNQLTPFAEQLNPRLTLSGLTADIAGSTKSKIGARLDVKLADAAATIPGYPDFKVNVLEFTYDTGSQHLVIHALDATDSLASLALSGIVEVRNRELDLKASVTNLNLSQYSIELPVQGAITAELSAVGTLDAPTVQGWAGVTETIWNGHRLGSVSADFDATRDRIVIKKFTVGGGEVSLSGSGVVTTSPSADITFDLAPTSFATLAKYAEIEPPAEGRVGVRGRVEYASNGRIAVTGTAYSPALSSNETRLESVKTDFTFDGTSLAARNLAFTYRTGAGVEARINASVDSRGITTRNPEFDVKGQVVLIGASQVEKKPEEMPQTDLVSLISMSETGEVIFVDPNAPKLGIVIYSTDPSRIGMEVWWPRLPAKEKSESGGENTKEPQAPSVGWIQDTMLSFAASRLAQSGTVAVVKSTEQADYPSVDFDANVAMIRTGNASKPALDIKGVMTVDGFLLKPIKIDFKGDGAFDDLKLYLTFAGRYKNRGYTARTGYRLRKGMPHEFEAYLLYGNSDFTVKGTLDQAKRDVNAIVSSSAIQLEDLLDLEGIYGTATLNAQVTGAIDSPTAQGRLELESAEYEIPKPPYSVIALTDGSFPFKVDKHAITLEKGSFSLLGSDLALEGSAGSEGMAVVLKGDDFSLDSLMEIFIPNVQIEGEGIISARVAGSLKQPNYFLDFEQKEGAVKGVPFREAKLTLSGNLENIIVSRLHIGSDSGAIDATGSLGLAGEHPVLANLALRNFEAGVLTPLMLTRTDAILEGKLNGSIDVIGKLANPQTSVALSLSDGSILGQDVSVDLKFHAQKDLINLEYFEAYAGESTVQASGVIRDTIADSELNIEIPLLDLSLVNPFMGYNEDNGFRGRLSATTFVKSGARGPYMSGSISGSNGLGFGLVNLAGVSGAFEIYPDLLRFKKMLFSTEDSALVVDGDVPIHALSEGMQETLRSGRLTELSSELADVESKPGNDTGAKDEALRFNINLQAENFSLAYIKTILPETGLDIGGTFSANLTVSGSAEYPVVDGALKLAARDIGYLDYGSIGGVDGEVKVVYDPDSASQRFMLGSFIITDPETVPDEQKETKPRRKVNPDETMPHTIEVGGGGTFRLLPFSIHTINLSALLNNFRKFKLLDIYNGPIEGQIFIEKDLDETNIHIGGEVSLGKGGTITLKMPDSKAPKRKRQLPITIGLRAGGTASQPIADTSEATDVRSPSFRPFIEPPLQPFKVYVNEGMNVRFPPIVDLRAEIQGAKTQTGEIIPLKIKGETSDLSISGTLQSYEGSLIVHRHTFRVVEPPLEIRFDPKWGFVPYIKGKAAVVIPGAGSSGSDSLGFDEDLTVYVNLDALATDLTEIRLTSDPPLSDEEIKRRMLGMLPPEGTVQGLSPEIRDEIYNLVGARVSRILEEKLNIEQFALRIGEENELYVDIEKYITDDLSVLYSATLFGNDDINEREQFGMRYLFLKKRFVLGYIEAFYDNSDSNFVGNEIRIVLRRKF